MPRAWVSLLWATDAFQAVQRARGPRTSSYSRWGTESTCQTREGSCRKCVYHPPIHSVTLPWLCQLEGKAALGPRGDCNCFKVPAKGNCVTTCLISPGCKMRRNQRRLFPSAGAAGSRRPLCFIYKPVYYGEPSGWRSSP